MSNNEQQTEQAQAQQAPHLRQTETHAQIKARLMAAAEAAIDGLLQWEAQTVKQNVKPNMTAIEEQVLAVRQQLGVALAEALLATQAAEAAAAQAVETPRCPTCGTDLVNKGRRKKVVTTRLGELESERPYAYCPVCKRGVFPPGRTT